MKKIMAGVAALAVVLSLTYVSAVKADDAVTEEFEKLDFT